MAFERRRNGGFFRLRRTGLVAGLALGVIGGGAMAQTPAAPAPTYGAPIAGMCLFAQAEAVGRSQAGVSANQQLGQFAQGMNAELKAEQSAIVDDDKALAKQKASLAAAVFEQRVGELRQRYAELERTKSTRAAQLELTRQKALAEVAGALAPSLTATISARRCSVVFEKNGTYGSAEAMDITPAVIELMNARLTAVPLRLATPEEVRAAQSKP